MAYRQYLKNMPSFNSLSQYEIEKLDRSKNVEDITAERGLDMDKTVHLITGPAAGTYEVILPEPSEKHIGQFQVITMIGTTGTNTVTVALTNVIGGTAGTTATFDAAYETLVLLGVESLTAVRWLVMREHGVTLS